MSLELELAEPKFEIFQFHKKNFKVLYDPDPWFIVSEIAEVLNISNSRHIVKSLDADERRKITQKELLRTFDVRKRGGTLDGIWIINESGLYQFLMRSNKPNALSFQKWIRKTVLPGIRKGEIVAKSKIESPIIKSPPKSIITPKKKGDLLPAEKLLQSYQAFKELFNDFGYGDDQLIKSLCLATALLNNPDVKIPGIERLISKVLEQGNYTELITALENYLNKNNSKI